MKIQSIGIISNLGRGEASLFHALENGGVPPSMMEVPFQDQPFPVFAVQADVLKDRTVLKQARRADRFSKMATLAAYDAWREGGLEGSDPSRVGMVVGTAFGPHPTVFNVLDDILSYGDSGVSPTLFSHSVHNAAAAYISMATGVTGPAVSLTSFTSSLIQGMTIARMWLEEDVCDSVLVGCVEECGAVLEYVLSEKLPLAENGMRPFFHKEGPAVIPGEGAVFFAVKKKQPEENGITIQPGPRRAGSDLTILDFECRKNSHVQACCWSHLTGSSPLSSAVSCATGVLILKKGRNFYPTNCIKAGNEAASQDIKTVLCETYGGSVLGMAQEGAAS